MDAQVFQKYLDILSSLSSTLEELSRIEQEKTKAVKQDDLDGLHHCMKQEQAHSLRLRSFEQSRAETLGKLGLEAVSLRDLPDSAPPELRYVTRRTVEMLQTSYKVFQSSFEVAQHTLEISLHEIDSYLVSRGLDLGVQAQFGEVAPPSSLRTDFRA